MIIAAALRLIISASIISASYPIPYLRVLAGRTGDDGKDINRGKE
jgi:hypothetical protein